MTSIKRPSLSRKKHFCLLHSVESAGISSPDFKILKQSISLRHRYVLVLRLLLWPLHMMVIRKPSVLYADAGYPTAADVCDSRLDGTEIISPITLRNQPEDVILRDRFKFDKNGLCTACPAGHAPVRH